MTTNTCERNALGTRVPGSDRAAGRPGTIDRFALGEAAIILLEDSCVLALNGTTASTAGVHLMITHGTGLIQVAVDTSRLNRLAIPPMIADVDARAHSAHVAVDAAAGIGTGISAADRARTIRLLADPQSKMEDFTRPGHILPVGTTPKIAQASDVAETVSRLSALAGSQPAVAAYCDVVSLGKPTALADPAEGKQMSEKLGIPWLSATDIEIGTRSTGRAPLGFERSE